MQFEVLPASASVAVMVFTLAAVPREAFIASSDLAKHISGHSIPARAALQQILDALAPLRI
jgi:hypothetical protein